MVHIGDERVDISHSQCPLLEQEFPHKFIHSMGGRNELHLVLPVLPGLQTYPLNSCPRTQDLLIEDHSDESWAVVRTHHAVYPIPHELPNVTSFIPHPACSLYDRPMRSLNMTNETAERRNRWATASRCSNAFSKLVGGPVRVTMGKRPDVLPYHTRVGDASGEGILNLTVILIEQLDDDN